MQAYAQHLLGTERLNSGDYGNPAPATKDPEPYAYPPPDEPEDEEQPDFWNLEDNKQMNSSKLVIEIRECSTNLQGLSMGLSGDPRIAGCGLFWASREKKPWQQEGNTVLLGLLDTSHIIKGTVEFSSEPYGKTGLIAVLRLTRVEWPDEVKFLGTAKGITEFQAGFFEVFAHSISDAPAKHYRNHWGE